MLTASREFFAEPDDVRNAMTGDLKESLDHGIDHGPNQLPTTRGFKSDATRQRTMVRAPKVGLQVSMINCPSVTVVTVAAVIMSTKPFPSPVG